MNKTCAFLALALAVSALGAAPALNPLYDSLYQSYASRDLATAEALLGRIEAGARSPSDRFAARLERGDYLLDKTQDWAGAEAAYAALAADNPKHRQLPDVLYRLALAQELQEKYLDAARNYEKVATHYSKTTFGTDALDAIERCFRKNYQERVAYVDGYPLTRIEIDDRISRNPTAYDSFSRKQALLDTMIENRLLYAAALAAGVTSDPAYLFNLSEARNRAMFNEWYERSVNQKAQPTDREISAAYRADLASRYTTPEKVHGWQIMVGTRATADSLRRLLVADTTLVWDSLAKENSLAPDKERGGDMGLFARGVQPREIEGPAFKLKTGEVSKPIQTKDGFVLLKVTEHKPKVVKTLADVKSQIAADLRQKNTSRIYEATVAELKARAGVASDSLALEQGGETLATVYSTAITRDMLETRLNAVPAFFRAQFDSPEGRKRILDQLVFEKILSREAEAGKFWLVNKVVDQVLSRRNSLIIDTYRRMMTSDKVRFDSAALYADYQATIKDFKEPAKVHAREITVPNAARADQLRAWAVRGKLPPMAHGRGLLVPDSTAAAASIEQFLTGNADSIAAQCPLANSPVQLPRLTTVQFAGKSLPDLGAKTKLAGPYQPGLACYGLGFADLARTDRLYQPELVTVGTVDELHALLDGRTYPADSTRMGTYVRLTQPLSAELVSGLFGAEEKPVRRLRTPSGLLVLKVTRKDTAQKATFADIARRFSTSTGRWSGGDLYWLTRDDKAHDARLVRAAFNLSTGGISPVIKMSDSAFALVYAEEKKDAYTRPFSEVRGKIENKLRRNEETALYGQLVQDLRGRASIEVLMKESDFVVEPPPEEGLTPTEPIPATESKEK